MKLVILGNKEQIVYALKMLSHATNSGKMPPYSNMDDNTLSNGAIIDFEFTDGITIEDCCSEEIVDPNTEEVTALTREKF